MIAELVRARGHLLTSGGVDFTFPGIYWTYLGSFRSLGAPHDEVLAARFYRRDPMQGAILTHTLCMGASIEKEFAGKKRASVWTYLILAVLLLAGAIIANLVIKDPTAAKAAVQKFVGLPTWALATIALVVGLLIYWLGLKVETDWPEFLGAFIVAGAITVFELLIGWQRLEFGLVVVPYVIPLLVFLVMIIVAVKRSV